MEFAETDFVPLDDFSLRWRFADAMYGYVSPDFARRVRPLSPERAAALSIEARARCTAAEERTRDGVEIDANKGPKHVRAQLRALPVPARTLVVVSWDQHTALVTDWEAFAAHWDDFCYPSSDDVTVWSPEASWTVCYWHFGVLLFGSEPRAV